MAPCIISPHKNIPATLTSSSAPRPFRLSRKWPPPGTSHPSATAGAHAPIGGIGCFCSFSLAIVHELPVYQPERHRFTRVKFSASSVEPDPISFATSGYLHSGRQCAGLTAVPLISPAPQTRADRIPCAHYRKQHQVAFLQPALGDGV